MTSTEPSAWATKRAAYLVAWQDVPVGDALQRAQAEEKRAATQKDQTRVLSCAGETIATYGHEFYPGHIAAVVYELNPHLTVQSTEDGGKTWADVTDRSVPYA